MRYPLRLALLAAFALAPPAAVAEEPALKVVASFSIIGDFARQVGGDRIALTTLVGPDGDAHVYEPRPADAAAMGEADVILVNGVGFEGFLGRLASASGAKAAVTELARGAELIEGGDAHHDDGHGHEASEAADGKDRHGVTDPHAFQAIPNAEIYVEGIADALCIADEAGCPQYRKNAGRYVETLKQLDREVRDTVSKIPADKRVIITSHDAFGYFAHEYGLTFLAPEGVSTDSEASAADVAALVRQIREDAASAIFVENVTNRRLIEQIARETGLKIGGSLYTDALSAAGGPAATYVEMMRHNLRTIAGAIQGS